MISDSHLLAFSLDSGGRGSNDDSNRRREEFVSLVIGANPETRDHYRQLVTNTRLFDIIVSSLDHAILGLGTMDPNLEGMRPNRALRAGGRSNNFDLLLELTDGRKSSQLKIELKKGRSIFDQPQFLSLYVNAPGVTINSEPNYAEYFFDKYFPKVRELTGCPPIGRSEYLRFVYGTSYNEPTFSHLYKFVKSSPLNRNLLSTLQHQSIDAYLRRIAENPDAIDFANLQARLLEQIEKWFLSWEAGSQSFSWERFTREELTLTGSIRKKTRQGGQVSTLALPTQTGQEIQMLLRWKNNPCVKGPAWQVRLTLN